MKNNRTYNMTSHCQMYQTEPEQKAKTHWISLRGLILYTGNRWVSFKNNKCPFSQEIFFPQVLSRPFRLQQKSIGIQSTQNEVTIFLEVAYWFNLRRCYRLVDGGDVWMLKPIEGRDWYHPCLEIFSLCLAYVHDKCDKCTVGKCTLHKLHGIANRVIHAKFLQNGETALQWTKAIRYRSTLYKKQEKEGTNKQP